MAFGMKGTPSAESLHLVACISVVVWEVTFECMLVISHIKAYQCSLSGSDTLV